MSIGLDIKDAVSEVGAAITLSGESATEHILYTANEQVTKPFIREFFIEAVFPHDTTANVGNIVEIGVIDQQFILMNKTPEVFENEIFRHQCVLYKCNVSGEIFRPSGEDVWDSNYQKTTQFQTIEVVAFGLQSEPLFGTDLETDEELGLIGLNRDELFIPSFYGIQELDRYQPSSGEYYMVQTVLTRRFPGVDVVKLTDDTR